MVTSTNYTNKQVRAFTGFDLSGIPAGVTVTSATLYLDTYEHNNGDQVDPFLIDHVNYGAGLDAGDYGAAAIDSAFANFNFTTSDQSFNVFDQVQYSYTNAAVGSLFQVRIRPTSIAANATPDYQLIRSADDASVKPYIKVYYSTVPQLGDAVTNIADVQGANITIIHL